MYFKNSVKLFSRVFWPALFFVLAQYKNITYKKIDSILPDDENVSFFIVNFFLKISRDHLPEAPVDYQVPTVKAGPTANVTLHSDRLTKFEEKTTPSLGSNSSETSTKPAIVFRKRKINDDHRKHARRRDDE